MPITCDPTTLLRGVVYAKRRCQLQLNFERAVKELTRTKKCSYPAAVILKYAKKPVRFRANDMDEPKLIRKKLEKATDWGRVASSGRFSLLKTVAAIEEVEPYSGRGRTYGNALKKWGWGVDVKMVHEWVKKPTVVKYRNTFYLLCGCA